MKPKRIWISRDKHDFPDRVFFWINKPANYDKNYKHQNIISNLQIGSLFIDKLFDGFGLRKGQCKCFELREVKK